MSKKYWEVTLVEADDKSGDLILPFPQDLLEEMGWKENDLLDLYVDSAGRLNIRKLPAKAL